jgi:hypothetical protein
MSRVRAALWSVCAFATSHLLVGALRLPTLTYDPIARTLRFTSDVGGVSMRYYGQLAWACTAAILVGSARLGSGRPPRRTAPLTGAALSLVAIDVAWYLSRLFAPV